MPDTLQALNAQRNYLESILQDLHGLTYGNGLVGFLLIQEVVLDDKNMCFQKVFHSIRYSRVIQYCDVCSYHQGIKYCRVTYCKNMRSF